MVRDQQQTQSQISLGWEDSVYSPVVTPGELVWALNPCWAQQRPSKYLQVLAESVTNMCFFPVMLLVMMNFFRWGKQTQTLIYWSFSPIHWSTTIQKIAKCWSRQSDTNVLGIQKCVADVWLWPNIFS